MLSIYESPNSDASQVTETLVVVAAPEIATVESMAVAPHEAASDDEPNIALAPEEIATLSSLVRRYDELLIEVDALNQQIEDLLKAETPVRTDIAPSSPIV